MKAFIVTLSLITGYTWDEKLGEYDTNAPKLKTVEYTVNAQNEQTAIAIAKHLDKSAYSIWETYACEL